jgi:YggT family protein
MKLMVYLVHQILQLYIYIIIADIILSYLPQYRNQKWALIIHKAADATLRPIREALPQGMPLDPSPMIVLILIQIIMYLL